MISIVFFLILQKFTNVQCAKFWQITDIHYDTLYQKNGDTKNLCHFRLVSDIQSITLLLTHLFRIHAQANYYIFANLSLHPVLVVPIGVLLVIL